MQHYLLDAVEMAVGSGSGSLLPLLSAPSSLLSQYQDAIFSVAASCCSRLAIYQHQPDIYLHAGSVSNDNYFTNNNRTLFIIAKTR